MTLLNLKHFLIVTQLESCLKGIFCKIKFHVCYHFFRYENPGRKFYQTMLLFLSDLNLYSKSLLTGVSANVTLRIVFDFKKKHLPFSNKPFQPEMNFIVNKHLPGLFMSCPRLLHVTV